MQIFLPNLKMKIIFFRMNIIININNNFSYSYKKNCCSHVAIKMIDFSYCFIYFYLDKRVQN